MRRRKGVRQSSGLCGRRGENVREDEGEGDRGGRGEVARCVRREPEVGGKIEPVKGRNTARNAERAWKRDGVIGMSRWK